MKRIGLLSDTHGHLDSRMPELFKDCDEIWHAGDIGSLAVTDALSAIKPLRAVYGNIDDHIARAAFPEYTFFTLEGVKVLMIHIAGSFGKYHPLVRKIIREQGPADLLVCGHSHILKVQMDHAFKCLYMNPGAAGVYGFHKMRTCLRFSLNNGRIEQLELIELGQRGALK